MTANPNHVPQQQPELNDQERALFDIRKLNEWRTRQFGILSGLQAAQGFSQITLNGDEPQYLIDFKNTIDSTLDDFLAENQIEPSDTNYAEIRQLYRDASIDKHGKEEWDYSPASLGVDPNETESQEDKFINLIDTRIADAPDGTNHGDHPLSADEWAGMKDDVESEMDELLQSYGQKIGERSKKIVERANTREDIDRLKEEASDYVSAFATQMMDELSEQGKTEQEIADAIDAFVNEQMDKIMSAMEQHRVDSYEKSWPISKKFYDKWAKWTKQGEKENGKQKFFSVGRFKKMAAIALPAAGVTAGAVALAPVSIGIGTGAAIIGGAGLVARSVGKSLAGGFLDRKSSQKKLAEEQSEQIKAEYLRRVVESEQSQRKSIFEVADEYSDYYRKQNRNRMIASTAIAATVGVLSGTAAGYLSDVASGHADISKPIDWLKDKFGDKDAGTNAGKDPEVKADALVYGPFAPEIDPNDIDGDGVINAEDIAPRNADYAHIDFDAISQDTRFIDRGEGGFQTLNELGVPEAKWEEVWADAGERFSESGKTYMMDDGHWGWSEPGRMSNDDITELVKAARRNGVALDYALTA